MGLEFGLDRMNKATFEQFNGDKKAFQEWANKYEDNHETVWCGVGRGNPIETWFKRGLHYIDDYDGYLMRPLNADDIHHVIINATEWFKDYINPQPVAILRAFKENNTTGDLIVSDIDGVEAYAADDAYRRIYTEDTERRLFLTKDECLYAITINNYNQFIEDMMFILTDMNWKEDVLLYWVSY